MKKKILFVTQQLGCGGVEKALVNLLKLINREQYECELLVIENTGEFCDFFPEWLKVNEYECPDYVKMMANYYRKPQLLKSDSWSIKASKICWTLIHYLNKISTKIFKKNISYRVIFEKYRKRNDYFNYDMIVDFHGYGVYTTYLTAYQKTNAKKVSWIHEETIYSAYKYIGCCYKYFNHIFGNCLDSCNNFVKVFSKCKGKVSTYYNYLDVNEIKDKAESEKANLFESSDFKIVSVGRVSEQKSFKRTVEVTEILKNKGYKFEWIVVGDGPEINEIREAIGRKALRDYLKFVGYNRNPYSFIKQADLYVQTSRAEGFCTTISEAVILGKPIVSTKVGGIDEQLDGGKGGIITEHTPESIAEGIEKLFDDKQLMKKLEEHNKSKKMNFDEEIDKLYKVM